MIHIFLLALDEGKKGNFDAKLQKYIIHTLLSIYTPKVEGIDTYLLNI